LRIGNLAGGCGRREIGVRVPDGGAAHWLAGRTSWAGGTPIRRRLRRDDRLSVEPPRPSMAGLLGEDLAEAIRGGLLDEGDDVVDEPGNDLVELAHASTHTHIRA
jgi:hypothetical protein